MVSTSLVCFEFDLIFDSIKPKSGQNCNWLQIVICFGRKSCYFAANTQGLNVSNWKNVSTDQFCLSICLSVSPTMNPSICLSFFLSLSVGLYLYFYLCAFVRVCPHVFLFHCQYIFSLYISNLRQWWIKG